MKIIQQAQIRNNKLAFKSNERQVFNILGEVKNRNTTNFFRNDIKDWDAFSKYLTTKFKDKKTNIYCYACSDGSEPYSIAMMLLSKLGVKKAQNFFPIIAKDKDKFILKRAQKGLVELQSIDIGQIDKFTKHPASDFFETIRDSDDLFCENFGLSELKSDFKKTVIFQKANILKDVPNIKKDNSVVIFRIAWPYMSEWKRNILLKKLHRQLGENSILVIAQWDFYKCKLEEPLKKNGFVPSTFDFCYENTPPVSSKKKWFFF